MKNCRFFVLIIFLTINMYSCRKHENPLNAIKEKTSPWIEIARIDDINYPKILFLNENIGFVAANVNYDSIHLKGPSFGWMSLEEGIKVEETSLISTAPSQTKYPLWKTIDGGETWNPVKGYFKTSIRDIYFIDESIGFLITEYEGVFKTLNQGLSWKRIFGSKIWLHRPGSLSSTFPSKICFYNKDNGFIYTGSTEKNFLYLFTENGGDTWEYKFLTFRAEKYIFPEKDINIGYASKHSGIYKTEDGGFTWNVILEDIHSPSISFIDINNGLYRQNGQIYKTTNGGKSFHQTVEKVFIRHSILSKNGYGIFNLMI